MKGSIKNIPDVTKLNKQTNKISRHVIENIFKSKRP